MTHSQKLRKKMGLTNYALKRALNAFWTHQKLAELFPTFLIYLHFIMRASVPLMEAAIDRIKETTASDPLAEGLVSYLTEHILEERHHDEWILDDLEVLGLSRKDVLSKIPSPTVAALVGAQYYWIFHYHPVALLGYIAVLEGSPPLVEHIVEVQAKTALPRDVFRTYLKHAHLDPHHCQNLDRILDSLPLTREHSTIIGISASHTAQLLACSLEEFVAKETQGNASCSIYSSL
ncbi:MAG: iron-containing redox enzyme family protein [Ktedonobacteraceae bacterium]